MKKTTICGISPERLSEINGRSDAKADFAKGRTEPYDWNRGCHYNRVYEAAYWETMDWLIKNKQEWMADQYAGTCPNMGDCSK